jgi:hypothetical protein
VGANAPLSPEKLADIKQAMKKGAKLCIAYAQKKTFLTHLSKTEADFPDLHEKEKHALIIEREERVKKFNEKYGDDSFNILKENLVDSVNSEDFSKLIPMLRDKLMLLDVTISPMASMAIELVKILLQEDNLTNRTLIFAYFLAVVTKLDSDRNLGDLVVGTYLHHIGLTQLESFFCTKPFVQLSDKSKSR